MALWAQIKAIQQVLNLSEYGFPVEPTINVPVEARQGPHPMCYIEPPHISFASEFLRAEYSTGTTALINVYLVLRVDDLPNGVDDLDQYMIDILSPMLKALIEAGMGDGTFINAGRGGRVAVTAFDYDHRFGEVIGAMRMTLEVSQFE